MRRLNVRRAYARSYLNNRFIPFRKRRRHLTLIEFHFFLKLIVLAEKILVLTQIQSTLALSLLQSSNHANSRWKHWSGEKKPSQQLS